MTTTVHVGMGRSTVAFDANKHAVDLGYFWARTFFEELGLNVDPNDEGMIGEHPIRDFKKRCETYCGHRPAHAERIVQLCDAGILEGATRVYWA